MLEVAKKDREYLQNLTDKGGEIIFPSKNPNTGSNVYLIDKPIEVSSGCHIILDGCTLRLADGVYSNIFISKGAYDDSPRLRDISVIGKNGAKLDGGTPNGLTEKTANKNGLPSVLHNTFILFRNVDGFEVSNLLLCDPRYWCMTFYYCKNGKISDIEFKASDNVPNQDGIDLRRGCHDICIENISGSTGDDTVALTALGSVGEDKFSVASECDDIYNVKISDVSSDVTGGHGIIRLLCQDGIKLHDVEITDIYDRHIDNGGKTNQAAIRLGDVNYWTKSQAVYGDMYNIKIENVKTNSPVPIKICGEIPGLEMTNIEQVK